MRRVYAFQWFFPPLICVLVGLYFSTSEYFNKRARGEAVSVLQIAAELLTYWLVWAMFSPLILILARRFPLERPQLLRSLLIHVPVGVFCAILSTGLYLLVLNISDNFMKARPFQTLNLYRTLPSGIIPNVIIYWTILAINLIFYYYERYQNELLKASQLNAQLSDARLQALKMQMHPHFLFNTLHSITALVLKNENRDAIKMINRLSEFLRLTLDNADLQLVTLKDELEFTRRYLEIERIRFQDRLTAGMDIDPKALEAQVPNMILQPLVENAMRHGVDSNSETSRIEIVVHLQNGQVLLEVRDDGKDFKQADEQSSSGLGLKNTRGRLSELYGEDYRFSLTRKENEWTVARIVIPFLPVKEHSKGEQY
jgi:sensor histidine kinase YesM